MKKNDWILAGAVILTAAVFILFQFISAKDGGTAVVTVNGETYGTYSLSEDKTVRINESNRLIIENQTVRMEWADCPDQICVHHRAISKDGESIICLPNKVTVTVTGGKTSDMDGIVQ